MTSSGESFDFEAELEVANRALYSDPTEARSRFHHIREALSEDRYAERGVVAERLSIVERILGKFDLARDLALEAASLADRVDDPSAVSRARVSLGNIAWSIGDLESALVHYQTAYRIRKDQDDEAATAGALASIANILAEQGRFSKAREEYETVLVLAHRAGDRRIVARTENNLAECLLNLNLPSDALQHAESSLKTCRKLGDRSEEPNVLINLAKAQIAMQFWQDAHGSISAGLLLADQIGDRRAEAELSLVRARLLFAHPSVEPDESFTEAEDSALDLARVICADGLAREICNAAIAHAMETKNRDRVSRFTTIRQSLK